MTSEHRWSREDLIQVEYELYALTLDQARRSRRENTIVVAADFLEVDTEDLVKVSHDVSMIDTPPLLIEVGRQVSMLPSAKELGAAPPEPITWDTVDLGGQIARVPKYFFYPVPAGELSEVPVAVRGWPNNGGMTQYVEVFARPGDGRHADAFLANLMAAGRGSASPYFGRVLEAYYGQGGLNLRVVELEPTDRSMLVLGDSVWDAVERNVDRMLEKMDQMDRAGLGTNRGLILAGPPGTGKSALCRALALEYSGRLTVTIVSAAAGQHLLGEVYTRIDQLSPGLVLIEDLDLLVGDREDRERFPLVEFLTVLDGLMTRHSRIITIATTNDARLVDDAALRAARFDQVVELSLPDTLQRADILSVYLRHVEHSVDVKECARRTDGFSGADLREVIRAALLDAQEDLITQSELETAISRRRAVVEDERPSGMYR